MLGEGAHLLCAAHELLAIKPHVVVCARLRGEEVRNVVGQLCGMSVLRSLQGRRRGDDVAVHVTAGTQRGAHVLDHCGEHGLEVLLEDTVQLEGLAGGEAHGAVAVLVGQLVHGQVQSIGDSAARLPSAHHELIELPLAESTLLAMVLLVASMELHQLHARLTDKCVLIHQILHRQQQRELEN